MFMKIEGETAPCPVCLRPMPWDRFCDGVPQGEPLVYEWCEDCCCSVMALVSEEEEDDDLAIEFKSSFSRAQLDIIASYTSTWHRLHCRSRNQHEHQELL